MTRETKPGSKIVALGHYQPSRVLTNDDLAQMVDTNDEWIQQRLGIKERRIADSESVADMAGFAAEKALAASGMNPGDIDLLIVATCSAVDRSPNVSTRVAGKLGIAPASMDINTACSGFCYGLANADHAIRAGAARNALVIGSEKLSDITDWSDRSTCVIFGDAAGAAVVTGVEKGEQPGIGPVVWGSEPSDAILIEGWRPYIIQEGQRVFRWATTQVPGIALAACEQAGIAPAELGGFVPHQANLRIIEPVARKLGVNPEVVARDIVESGNTSAASIPLAMSKMIERGELKSGTPVLLVGFGGGLTYAGQVVRCP